MSYFSNLHLEMRLMGATLFGVKNTCSKCGEPMSIYGVISPYKYRAFCVNTHCLNNEIEKVIEK